MSDLKRWTIAVVCSANLLWIAAVGGWQAHKRSVSKDQLPKFPWVKVGSTNTVTITNVVTQYALEILIQESDGKRQWTNRTLLRYKGVDSSKPFVPDVEEK